MKAGYVVVAKSHANPLACGSGIYTHAICVQADPLVLVSEPGDMLWCKKMPYDLIPLCEASPRARRKAFARFKKWQREQVIDEGLAYSERRR